MRLKIANKKARSQERASMTFANSLRSNSGSNRWFGWSRGRCLNLRNLKFPNHSGDDSQDLSRRWGIGTRDSGRQLIGSFLDRANDHGMAVIQSCHMASRLQWSVTRDDDVVTTDDIQTGE